QEQPAEQERKGGQGSQGDRRDSAFGRRRGDRSLTQPQCIPDRQPHPAALVARPFEQHFGDGLAPAGGAVAAGPEAHEDEFDALESLWIENLTQTLEDCFLFWGHRPALSMFMMGERGTPNGI